jgi:hypothetical protein
MYKYRSTDRVNLMAVAYIFIAIIALNLTLINRLRVDQIQKRKMNVINDTLTVKPPKTSYGYN